MSEPKIIYNPVTIAECGGPCEQGPEYCDCGELRINCPDISMTEHTLTDEICDQIVFSTPPLPRDQQDRVLSYDGRILDGMFEECFEEQKHQMRAAADWQLEEVVNAWEDAFQSDLEHGVRSLNDKAAKELAAKYPKIFAFGEVLNSMRPQEDQ